MKKYKERIVELYKQGFTSKTKIAKQLAKEMNVPYSDNIRRKVSYNFHRALDTGIFDECERVGIDPEKVSHYWYKGKNYSINVKASQEGPNIDFDSIINDCISNFKKVNKSQPKTKTKTFDRLVWTDVHVGMDASRKGLALYATEWNGDILMKRIEEMINFVLSNKKSDTLIIDELGDFMDGWDGETTRKGHKLPQNMTNEEAFDTGLKAKMLLINTLSEHYNSIVCNNICEDNHSGSFGYVLNSAFKSVVDCLHSNVTVNNYQKFINWYRIGKHTFVITHGKDSRNLKFGFKPQLDCRSIEKIDQFLKNNGIYKHSEFIEFSKGDSHQALFDMCSSDDFYYFNYPAFSPSSEWVQTNFKKGRSGFVFQVIDYDSDNRSIHPYYFNNI
jgi:hypothetical protein